MTLLSATLPQSVESSKQALRYVYASDVAHYQLLRVNPAAANKIKAFEIGSKIAKQQLATAAAVKKPKEELRAWPPLERPAKGDVKRKRQLVELSDEE